MTLIWREHKLHEENCFKKLPYTYHSLCGMAGVDTNSEHFTQPGLHMNASGEDKITRKISDVRIN
jgi:hypothetical protein